MKYIDYAEKQTHGTYNFPLAFYDVDQKHPRYQMVFHWHKECEILYIRSGTLKLCVDETNFELHAGDVAFLRGGQIHGGTPIDCHYQGIVFDMEFMMSPLATSNSDISLLLSGQKCITTYLPAALPHIHEAVGRINDDLFTRARGFEVKALGSLYHLFGEIIKGGYLEPSSNQDSQRMKQLRGALDFISENYQEKISLHDMAKSIGLTDSYFSELFSLYAHQTPMDYLNCYRVDQACIALLTTDKPITQIAFDCGFNDASYFTKVFKKYKGCKPSQFIKNQQLD